MLAMSDPSTFSPCTMQDDGRHNQGWPSPACTDGSSGDPDTMACRRLAAKIIMDAIDDARHGTKDRRRSAMLFLRGKIGDVGMWVDCLVGINKESILNALKHINSNDIGVKDERRRAAAARANRERLAALRADGTLPPRGGQVARHHVEHNGKRYTLHQAAELIGMPYATLYGRYKAHPEYSLARLAAAGKKKYSIKGKR